ncbi:hypothetical protein ACOTHJ_13785 [Achromobacter xylosoxidans]
MFLQPLINFFLRRKAPPAAPPAHTICTAPDAGPWRVSEWHTSNQLVLQSDAGAHRVALAIMGNFDSDDQRLAYANTLATWLNDQVAACTTIMSKPPTSTQADVSLETIAWPEHDENASISVHLSEQRRKSLGSAPSADDKPAGRYGCHCELPPGQMPDACVIDQGQRDNCCLAQDGRTRNSCEYWQPIQFVRAA